MDEQLKVAKEKLQRAQEELELFKQQLQFSDQTTSETTTRENYEATLEFLRRERKTADTKGIHDYATAMAFAQISIEERIKEMQDEVDKNTFYEVPLDDDAPPLTTEQPVGKLTRLKNWFKKLFFRSRQEEAPPEPEPPPQMIESRVEQLIQLKNQAKSIRSVTVDSRASEVRKMLRPEGSGPDDPPVTDQELKSLREEGIRGTAGNFLAKRYGPVFSPIKDEVADMARKLEEQEFDYGLAVSNLTEREQGSGKFSYNTPILAMVEKGMDAILAHVEQEGFQEYVRILYDSVGKSLQSLVKDNAYITREHLDEYVMSVFFTRGLDPFMDQTFRVLDKIKKAGGVTQPEDSAKMEFFKRVSAAFAKMEQIYKEYIKAGGGDKGLEALPEEFRGLIGPYEKIRDKVSAIGLQVGQARLQELNKDRKKPNTDT